MKGSLLTAYVIFSLVFAATGGWKAGAWVGFDTLVTSMLFMISGGRLKQIARMRWGRHQPGSENGDLVLAGVVLAVVLAGVAQWFSSGFTVRAADHVFAGSLWGWLGFAIAIVVF